MRLRCKQAAHWRPDLWKPTSLELGLSCLSGPQTSVLINSYLFLPIHLSFDPASLLFSSHFCSPIKCFSDSTWVNWIIPPISPTLCTENPLAASSWCIASHPSLTPGIYVDSNNTQGAPGSQCSPGPLHILLWSRNSSFTFLCLFLLQISLYQVYHPFHRSTFPSPHFPV